MNRAVTHARSRGFSLLEVLVAFVILALVLGTIMQIFSGGLRNASLASQFQQAALLGQSKLATVGIETPLKTGEYSGEFDRTYRWQLSIKPYPEAELNKESGVAATGSQSPAPTSTPPGSLNAGATPSPSTLGNPTTVLPVMLMEVELRILWGDGMQPRTVRLKTLKLANRSTV